MPAPRIEELVNQLADYINLIYAAGGLLFLGLAIFIGITWMTSAGNPEKIEELKGRFTYWVVGFVLFFLSWTLVYTTFQVFGVRECGDPTKPVIRPGFSSFFKDCP